jgi:methylmalonyl-CoA mutase N-terminal domain/subunit
MDKEKREELEKRKEEWEEVTLKKALDRFGAKESPSKVYTPLDIPDFDFLEKVGFPGEYPFTSGIYPASISAMGGSLIMGRGLESGGVKVRRAGMYSGYGTAEDTRDFYKAMAVRGWTGGPNIAFDLPTQCGYDSDDPVALGEVGKVGVAIDTLRDFEVIYEAFVGDNDLDKIASNFTINAPANIILAMYFVLAEKRGIPLKKLVATPQNEILKEILARGTYIFPLRPSMRMVRDSIVFCTEHTPRINYISIGGYHIREAGANGPQAAAFGLSNAIAYVQLGIDAGLDIDRFYPRLTLAGMGGSMDVMKEIAIGRASRRIWAKIMRERFKAKNPYPPYDEPLGLGYSLEAQQLSEDAFRIIHHETKLCEVVDPFAGSYFMESLTDQMEEEILEIMNKVDAMGGAVAAIENGYMQGEIARSAYEQQRQMEKGEKIVVGVNAYTGENELEVQPPRLVPLPYDSKKREEAEQRQIANLSNVKQERDNEAVKASLKRLKEAAQDESVNLIPLLMDSVKLYASLGEMCGVLKEVFGEYQEASS